MLPILALLVFSDYSWLASAPTRRVADLKLPPGYTRVTVEPNSFAAWLRGLPLKEGRPQVKLFDGREKRNQQAHHAVVEIDVGKRNLQQCADAVMRLRAEYLFAHEQPVAFNFTSGDRARWRDWREGQRPVVKGNQVHWKNGAGRDDSYANFRKFLNTVFAYAGTWSLKKELVGVADSRKLKAGDVFIQGGFPGHAVLVVDVAENTRGERVFMVVQSYMPAQDMHVLRGPKSEVWYPAKTDGNLETPEWTFAYEDLRRFKP